MNIKAVKVLYSQKSIFLFNLSITSNFKVLLKLFKESIKSKVGIEKRKKL